MVAVKDLAEVVDHAKAELERLITLGRLQNDPLRYPLDGLGVVLDALVDVVDEVQAARAPTMTDEQVGVVARRFANAGVGLVAAIVRNELRRILALLVLTWAVIGLFGFEVGRWSTPTLTCDDQRGGRVCWAWTAPPTVGQK